MSKGVANVTRKTWDKAFFEQQAALRASGALEEDEKKTKKIDLAREEFQPAAEDAAGPAGSVRAFLKLGFSMRVEQSSVASVKDRLNAAAKRKWDPEITKKLDAVEAYEKKLAALDEEAQAKKAKRKEAKAPTPAVDVFASAEEEAMMAAMGFGGFNSTKKK
ncbi:hypothetical protein DYB28_000055 [Aphanomyces astaci]|uniref:U4/U6.U5 small nuclear ribonucleoprotein 27kDa protein domain-containing protein n=1 Tax=Aphanomyces astaci TaxID=112090 RepID=A0A9X8E0J8_APHAT|nr:hypothetical protein DYB28_000055 [Aphanomyces astaci]